MQRYHTENEMSPLLACSLGWGCTICWSTRRLLGALSAVAFTCPLRGHRSSQLCSRPSQMSSLSSQCSAGSVPGRDCGAPRVSTQWVVQASTLCRDVRARLTRTTPNPLHMQGVKRGWKLGHRAVDHSMCQDDGDELNTSANGLEEGGETKAIRCVDDTKYGESTRGRNIFQEDCEIMG